MKKAAFCLCFLILFQGTKAQTGTASAAGPAGRKQSQELVEEQAIAASPSVFAGNKFPAIDFVEKALVQRALGPYTLKVRYFDAHWQEVTQPTVDGRYGAVVEVHFADGVSDVRHLTLFHVGKDYSSAKDPYHVTLLFPKGLALPASLTKSESWNIDQYLNYRFDEMREKGDDYAFFLAAMHDIATDPVRFGGFESLRIDNMWWQEWERRQGLDVPYQKNIRLPEGYGQSPDKKWPLILFLHGSGERGNDLAKLKGQGPAGFVDGGHPLPFIIVTPQCRRSERWNPGLLMKLIEDTEKAYRVDSSRIYLTGLSMGGSGILDLAAAYPGKFAALASLSGRENPGIASRLQGIPVWFFHGMDDEVNPARFTVELVDVLKEEKAPVKLTLLPGVGHGGWDKIYANPELYAWFLQQER